MRVTIHACWCCGGTGRTRAGGPASDEPTLPCLICAGYGRLRIEYGVNASGEPTQEVKPQPDRLPTGRKPW
jgi:hypothetical protein